MTARSDNGFESMEAEDQFWAECEIEHQDNPFYDFEGAEMPDDTHEVHYLPDRTVAMWQRDIEALRIVYKVWASYDTLGLPVSPLVWANMLGILRLVLEHYPE